MYIYTHTHTHTHTNTCGRTFPGSMGVLAQSSAHRLASLDMSSSRSSRDCRRGSRRAGRCGARYKFAEVRIQHKWVYTHKSVQIRRSEYTRISEDTAEAQVRIHACVRIEHKHKLCVEEDTCVWRSACVRIEHKHK